MRCTLQVQRLWPGPALTPLLEHLLNALVATGGSSTGDNSGALIVEKAVVFDAPTKLLLASDSNPLQEGTFDVSSCTKSAAVRLHMCRLRVGTRSADKAATHHPPAPIDASTVDRLRLAGRHR